MKDVLKDKITKRFTKLLRLMASSTFWHSFPPLLGIEYWLLTGVCGVWTMKFTQQQWSYQRLFFEQSRGSYVSILLLFAKHCWSWCCYILLLLLLLLLLLKWENTGCEESKQFALNYTTVSDTARM